MEMLNSGQQPSIDTISEEFRLSDDLQVASAELKERLDWPEHGWPWGDYAAVISWVLKQRLPLYAANLNRETMHSLYKSGLDDRFQSARELKEVLHDSLLDQVFDGHCGLMPRDKLGSMLDIQLAKDSAMANALLAAETPQSVLIAGSGHIRKDTAVPRHLQQADSVITVALIEVDSEKTNVADYDLFERFDVAVFTPVANQRDYCAELEKSMKKH